MYRKKHLLLFPQVVVSAAAAVDRIVAADEGVAAKAVVVPRARLP